MMSVTWGKTASDYADHRLGFPNSLYNRIEDRIGAINGLRVLDLGTGTGTVAREFAARGAVVSGVDREEAMLEKARERTPTIDWRLSAAESLPYSDATFDLIAAGQCWHWFDRPVVAREAWRLLKEAGHLVIAHYDWIPVRGNVVEATEQLIKEHNPRWTGHGGTGVYPWHRDMDGAGYDIIESFTYDEPAVYSHVAWRGRIRASAGVGGMLNEDDVRKFDQALAERLAQTKAPDPMHVPHRVFCITGRKHGGGRPNRAVR